MSAKFFLLVISYQTAVTFYFQLYGSPKVKLQSEKRTFGCPSMQFSASVTGQYNTYKTVAQVRTTTPV